MKYLPKKPLLLSVVLYSLLVLQVILFLGIVILFFSLDNLDDIYSSFHLGERFNPYGSFLYLLVFIILIILFSIIQMLRQKIYAVHLFQFLSVILLVSLLFTQPIEWLNILLIVFVNIVIVINYSWFKDKRSTNIDIEENEDKDLEISETINQ